MNARAAVIPFLVAVCGACASDPGAAPGNGAAPAGAIPPDAKVVSDTISSKVAPAQDDSEFQRQLLAADQRTSEFEQLTTATGPEAAQRLDLVRSALEASVAQYFERFLAALKDTSNPTWRRVAARALAFSNDRRATAPLVAALGRGDDGALRTNAAFALARIADPDTSLPDLLRAAGDPDREIRTNSLLALWHVLDARRAAGRVLQASDRDAALPVVEAALFDPDSPIARGNAAAAMGALGDPRGVDPLLNLLRDTHPYVRSKTALALGKLGDRRAIQPLVGVIDETSRGSARNIVILSISMLLEKEGVAVPASMPDDESAWNGFLQRMLPAKR